MESSGKRKREPYFLQKLRERKEELDERWEALERNYDEMTIEQRARCIAVLTYCSRRLDDLTRQPIQR